MCPRVNLVGLTDEHKRQAPWRREYKRKANRSRQYRGPVAVPISVEQKRSGLLMVQFIRRRDVLANPRPFGAKVAVFGPMPKTAEEIGNQPARDDVT